MLPHSTFCIALHAGVHGGEYLESVSIDIIGRAIFFEVFVTPPEKRVAFPSNRVIYKFLSLPRSIVGGDGTTCSHNMTQIFAEVGGDAVPMGDPMEIQSQRFFLVHLAFLVSKVTLLLHELEH